MYTSAGITGLLSQQNAAFAQAGQLTHPAGQMQGAWTPHYRPVQSPSGYQVAAGAVEGLGATGHAAATGLGIANMIGMGAVALGKAGPIMGAMGSGAVFPALMAGEFAMGSMFHGLQSTSQAHSTLGTMSGSTVGGGGARGFSNAERGEIVETMRSLSQMKEFSKDLGEVTRMVKSFDQHGMLTGIRDAKEFSKKLKELAYGAKEIATTLGTSMDETVDVMKQMHTMGFAANQSGTFSRALRMQSDASGISSGQVLSGASQSANAFWQNGGTQGGGGVSYMRNLMLASSAVQHSNLFTDAEMMQGYGKTGKGAVLAMTEQMGQVGMNIGMMDHAPKKGLNRQTIALAFADINNGKATGGIDTGLMEQARMGMLSTTEMLGIAETNRKILGTKGMNSLKSNQAGIVADVTAQMGPVGFGLMQAKWFKSVQNSEGNDQLGRGLQEHMRDYFMVTGKANREVARHLAILVEKFSDVQANTLEIARNSAENAADRKAREYQSLGGWAKRAVSDTWDSGKSWMANIGAKAWDPLNEMLTQMGDSFFDRRPITTTAGQWAASSAKLLSAPMSTLTANMYHSGGTSEDVMGSYSTGGNPNGALYSAGQVLSMYPGGENGLLGFDYRNPHLKLEGTNSGGYDYSLTRGGMSMAHRYAKHVASGTMGSKWLSRIAPENREEALADAMAGYPNPSMNGTNPNSRNRGMNTRMNDNRIRAGEYSGEDTMGGMSAIYAMSMHPDNLDPILKGYLSTFKTGLDRVRSEAKDTSFTKTFTRVSKVGYDKGPAQFAEDTKNARLAVIEMARDIPGIAMQWDDEVPDFTRIAALGKAIEEGNLGVSGSGYGEMRVALEKQGLYLEEGELHNLFKFYSDHSAPGKKKEAHWNKLLTTLKTWDETTQKFTDSKSVAAVDAGTKRAKGLMATSSRNVRAELLNRFDSNSGDLKYLDAKKGTLTKAGRKRLGVYNYSEKALDNFDIDHFISREEGPTSGDLLENRPGQDTPESKILESLLETASVLDVGRANSKREGGDTLGFATAEDIAAVERDLLRLLTTAAGAANSLGKISKYGKVLGDFMEESATQSTTVPADPDHG